MNSITIVLICFLKNIITPLPRIFIRALVVRVRKNIKQPNQKQNDIHNNPIPTDGYTF